MTPIDALAAAIRERLISGRPAPLPGLGTLVRQHVSARVEERPDGTRVLLPPGETIGLAETDESHASLAPAFGRLQALAGPEADAAFRGAMDQLEARLAATGEVRLPGVGLLRRTSGGVILGVEANLLAAVNRAYEGLEPVGAEPSARPAGAVPEPTAPEPAEPEAAVPDATESEPAEEPGPEPADPDAFWALDIEEDPSPDPVWSPEGDASTEAPDDGPDLEEEPRFEPFSLDEIAPASAEPDEAEVPDEAPSFDEEWSFDEPLSFDARPPVTAELPDLADEDVLPSSAFVDDDTLDDDLDDVLAVPFGAPDDSPPLDILPPTPPEVDPSAGEAKSDDWESETWTPRDHTPPPSILDEPEYETFEDADFEVLPPEAVEAPDEPAPLVETEAPAPEPTDAPAPPEEPTPRSPEAELDALFSDPAPTAPLPPAVPAVPVALGPTPTAAPERPALTDDEARPRRRIGWWIAGLLLLALAVAAALWLMPQLRGAEPAPAPEEPPEAVTALPSPPDALADDGDSLSAQAAPDGASRTGTPDAGSSAQASPQGETAEAPAAADAPAAPASAPTVGALLPPRLDGLDDGDRRALVGPPIDPAMGGWTLIVASLRSEAAANAESARFREAGYRTAVFPPSGQTLTRYRVGVGQFGSRDHAERLRDRLPPQAAADTWPLNLRSL